ncbi:hypothetical protein QFZ82_004216 [Streptomyces sp. V4I23]|nr:hypothetical protein [Streptomyces sp. V4I23]
MSGAEYRIEVAGRGLGGVLGLVAEVQGPWTDEERHASPGTNWP